MDDLLSVVYQALFSFIVLFIISKLLGKKQVAQLEFTDYVVGISIGSIAAQMAVEPQIPYYHFVVAMFLYALLDLAITLISRKSKFLKKALKGSPLLVIKEGKIDYKILKKSKLDINELLSQCRLKGFFDISKIDYCFFEPSGDFSILAKPDNLPCEKTDLKIKTEARGISYNLVIDGKINEKELKLSKKNKLWLLRKAKVKNEKQLKDILLFCYFEKNNQYSIFYKETNL